MATLKYAAYGSSVALFGNTELASMANGSGTYGNGGGLTSNVFDNTTNLYPECDVIVQLGSLTPTSGGFIQLAFLWAPDGSNYDDPQYASGQSANNVPQGGTPIWSRGLTTSTGAKIVTFTGVKLRPGKAKILLVNNAGVALAATANSATMYPVTYTIS